MTSEERAFDIAIGRAEYWHRMYNNTSWWRFRQRRQQLAAWQHWIDKAHVHLEAIHDDRP